MQSYKKIFNNFAGNKKKSNFAAQKKNL